MSDWKYTEETQKLVDDLKQLVEVHREAQEQLLYCTEEYVNNAAIIRTCKGILDRIEELGD